jgi:hypothetical protein
LTAAADDKGAEHLERAIRYQNYAEDVRIIAAARTTPDSRQMLLRLVDSYERLAPQLEAMSNANRDQGLPR